MLLLLYWNEGELTGFDKGLLQAIVNKPCRFSTFEDDAAFQIFRYSAKIGFLEVFSMTFDY